MVASSYPLASSDSASKPSLVCVKRRAMTSVHFDSRNLLVVWDGAGESLTESVYKCTLSRAGCQKWCSYTLLAYLYSLAALRVSPFRTLWIISVLGTWYLLLNHFIHALFLPHGMEGSMLKGEHQEANFKSLSCCIDCSKCTMQKVSAHKFTLCSAAGFSGWLLFDLTGI